MWYIPQVVFTLFAFDNVAVISSDFRRFILQHDDVIKWKHFPRYWPFVRGIHRSSVNSQHKGQWRGYLMFSLICAWINGWVNDREAGDLRRHCTHYGVIVMTVVPLPMKLVSGIRPNRWNFPNSSVQLHLHCYANLIVLGPALTEAVFKLLGPPELVDRWMNWLKFVYFPV